ASRDASADELAQALRDGLAGFDVTLPLEEEGTTRALRTQEEGPATRRLPRTEDRRQRPVRRRAAPAPAPARARTRPAQRPRGGAFGRAMRGIAALIALVLIAAAVAAAVIFATDNATGPEIRRIAGATVDQVVEEMRDLINDNTQERPSGVAPPRGH